MIGLHIILTVNYKKGKELQLSFWATCVNEDGSSSDTCQETCLTEGCWENSWGLAELNCVIGRKNILLVSTYIWNIIVDVHLPLLAKCVCTVTGYKACKKQHQMSPIKVFQRCVLFPWGGEEMANYAAISHPPSLISHFLITGKDYQPRRTNPTSPLLSLLPSQLLLATVQTSKLEQ